MSDSDAADHNGSEGPPPVEHDPMAVFARMGDRIAGREGYTGLSGMDAVHRYLVERYHWTLDYVRDLSVDDLTILFAGDDAGRKDIRRGRG
jgi:hypothetical protein